MAELPVHYLGPSEVDPQKPAFGTSDLPRFSTGTQHLCLLSFCRISSWTISRVPKELNEPLKNFQGLWFAQLFKHLLQIRSGSHSLVQEFKPRIALSRQHRAHLGFSVPLFRCSSPIHSLSPSPLLCLKK